MTRMNDYNAESQKSLCKIVQSSTSAPRRGSFCHSSIHAAVAVSGFVNPLVPLTICFLSFSNDAVLLIPDIPFRSCLHIWWPCRVSYCSRNQPMMHSSQSCRRKSPTYSLVIPGGISVVGPTCRLLFSQIAIRRDQQTLKAPFWSTA